MERTNEPVAFRGIVSAAWAAVLALRPVFALTAVWLTTAGHSLYFREMYSAFGWVRQVGLSLHTMYLLSIALTLAVAPRLARWTGSYVLVIAGLGLLFAGSIVNGVLSSEPIAVLELGRVLAGIGSGLVIRSAPRILPAGYEGSAAWAGIMLPATGLVVFAYATDAYGWPWWQVSFLFEAVLALGSLALVLSITDPADADRDPQASPAVPLGYLPAAVVGYVAVWYVLHWGQLHGWLESPDIAAALVVASASFSLALWLAWPDLDQGAVREGLPRLGLIVYGGFVQYFNTADMSIYGGLLINVSPLMRSWLIWSLPLGLGAALAVGRMVWRRRSPGYAGATVGLLILAGGFALSHWNMINWPFWSLLNTVEFNWFAAPQHWQFAPARLLMGFGSGMLLLSLISHSSRLPEREAKIEPYLQVAQFSGAALSIGVFMTYLLIGHQIEYSFTADRGFIQSVEQADRRQRLVDALTSGGSAAPDRQSEALLYASVNFAADNLVFAQIFGAFFVASVALAGVSLVCWFVDRRG
jgi:hypothetical protein